MGMGKGEGAKSTGYRAGTRDLFTKKFRSHGYNAPITTFMRNYKVGDVVDVVCDSRQQKGMPHKYYHGRTGRVWNVTPHAVGVVVNKNLGGRIIHKRIHVRVEHVVKSRYRDEFLARVKSNDAAKIQAKKEGKKVATKRNPAMPKAGFTVKKAEVLTRNPVPYDPIY